MPRDATELLSSILQALVVEVKPERTYLLIDNVGPWMVHVAGQGWNLVCARQPTGEMVPIADGELYDVLAPDRTDTDSASPVVTQATASAVTQSGAGRLLAGRAITVDDLYNIAALRAMRWLDANNIDVVPPGSDAPVAETQPAAEQLHPT